MFNLRLIGKQMDKANINNFCYIIVGLVWSLDTIIIKKFVNELNIYKNCIQWTLVIKSTIEQQ